MDTDQMTSMIETEIPAAANQYARQLFEKLGKQVADHIDEQVRAWCQEIEYGDEDLEQIAKDVIQPAFMANVTCDLALQFAAAGGGWNTVLWSNMREKYRSE